MKTRTYLVNDCRTHRFIGHAYLTKSQFREYEKRRICNTLGTIAIEDLRSTSALVNLLENIGPMDPVYIVESPNQTPRRVYTFHRYHDPGHSWLKVPRAIVDQLGIQISYCSYQRGSWLYLEEDCDLHAFRIAAAQSGIYFRTIDHTTNSNSRIRNYQPYTPTEGAVKQ